VFTFSCVVFYNSNHPLGFLKGKEFPDMWSSYDGEEEQFCVEVGC
jgi:hypothetical protein